MIFYNFENTKINFLVFLIVRLLIGLFLIRTVHKADEYFQGPEVAHNIVYGYGQLSWEWTFKDPIRNPIFPLVYALGYYLIDLLNLSNTYFILITPKLIQALIGASFDTVILQLNNKYNSQKTNKLLVLLNFTNWVTLTYFSRTYVNSLESMLTTVAFFYWLKGIQLEQCRQKKLENQSVSQEQQELIKLNKHQPQDPSRNLFKKQNKTLNYDLLSRILVILTFIIRGTSVIYWVVVWPYQLLKYHSKTLSSSLKFIAKNIITLIVMVALSGIISVLWYRRFVWVQYNFFYYNVILGWSQLCGTQPFIQYFIIYQYKIFNLSVIFVVYGLYKIFSGVKQGISEKQDVKNRKFKQLVLLTLLVMLVLSLSSHKQLRFMLILIPAQLIVLIKGYTFFPYKKLKTLILFLSFFISGYFFVTRNMIIKKGGMKILQHIRENKQINQVLFHMQSYQVPLYSYIHRNITLIIPQAAFQTAILNKSELIFSKNNPKEYLSAVTQRLGHPPQYLVLTNQYLDNGKLVLQQSDWKRILSEWYPSPMPEHYNRRIYMYQYRGQNSRKEEI